MAGECLVIVDADRIHDYVFSPHRLRLIRGASALQAELNETDLPRRLREVGGRKIYAGGGTLMARFDDLESAQKFATWAQREYFERTRIATATAVAVEEKPEFRDTITTAFAALERRKTGRGERGFNGGSPFAKACEACGMHPAAAQTDRGQWVCAGCQARFDKGERRSAALRKVGWLVGKRLTAPDDFRDIGQRSKPENYMALVYLDVNRLGRHLHGERSSSPEEYQAASRCVRDAIRKGVLRACAAICGSGGETLQAPFEVLLLGGDDAVVAMAAQHALPFLKTFREVFAKQVAKQPKDANLTVSAGLVWAHATYPITEFVRKAEQLLQNAKRTNRGFAVDFMVVTEAMTDDPKRGGTARTERPYEWNALQELSRTLEEWKKSGMPSNKVRALYSMAFEEEKSQGELEFLFLRSRLSEKHQKMLDAVFPNRRLFPADDRRTKAADVAELWDFLEVR